MPKKLARSGRAERHLFVLLDSGEEVAWSVMLDGEPPEASPQLPEAVTTAWVTTIPVADGDPTVWQSRRPSRPLGSAAVVLLAPEEVAAEIAVELRKHR